MLFYGVFLFLAEFCSWKNVYLREFVLMFQKYRVMKFYYRLLCVIILICNFQFVAFSKGFSRKEAYSIPFSFLIEGSNMYKLLKTEYDDCE